MGGGMGKMSAPQMPPPMTDVTDKTAEEEAKLAAEKQRMLDTKKKGQYATILTSGEGLDEPVETQKTTLGGQTTIT
tara:strand:+ start:571 stop:798 length:228 start_codon:yes stop_codon:yes gene_type:complete